eukprot:6186627-Pleurochrysis_carterae.AAC.1
MHSHLEGRAARHRDRQHQRQPTSSSVEPLGGGWSAPEVRRLAAAEALGGAADSIAQPVHRVHMLQGEEVIVSVLADGELKVLG